MNRFLAGAVGFMAVIALAFLALRTPDSNREDMIAKYGGPEVKFADGAGGLRVHWRDEGCRDCPAIILLHGSNASLHTFEPVVRELAGEYRVITLDLPGHGITGPHPRDDYSANGMFEALNAVANAARLDRFTLGGNSMGGWVSWRYALAYPDRVEGLILLNASGSPLREGETAPPLNLRYRLARNPLLRPLIEHITPRNLIKTYVLETTAIDDIVTEGMVDRYWELLRFPGNRRAAALRMLVDREPEHFAQLSGLQTHTLILWGSDDQLVYPSAAQSFNERLANAEVVMLDNVGHLPMEEAPEATANAIRRFLESLAPEAVDTLKLEQGQ